MPEGAADLLAALRQILPEGVGAGWADPRHDHPRLAGEDLPRAVPARLREFAAGRHAARAAMRMAGLPEMAVPHGSDRALVWPDGVIGSITHSATDCLAVAAPLGRLRGIGIDLEPATPLERDLWDSILVLEEQFALNSAPPDQRGLLAKTIFCAKEASYKAQYRLSQTVFGFDAMVITLQQGRFTATFRTPLPPFHAGAQIAGQIAKEQGQIIALAHL